MSHQQTPHPTPDVPQTKKPPVNKLRSYKLEQPKELTELKTELDKANNFIDYFLVIGLDPEVAFSDWLYETNVEELNCIYKKEMTPKIISSFPPFEKHTIFYDESMIRHCFPEDFVIIQTKENEPKPEPKLFSFMLDNNYFSIHFPQKYLSCLLFYESVGDYQKLFDKNNEFEGINNEDVKTYTFQKTRFQHYIPKCLVIISLYPFFGEFEKILWELYCHSKQSNITCPIDKIIENLLIEVPIPPRGIFTVEYDLIGKKREIKQNLMNQLPLIDVDLRVLFKIFPAAKDIVNIYRYIMLESRVLFFSADVKLLNPFIFGLLSMLYPFNYQYQVVTILPKENFETLESITPFIAGINQSYTDSFFADKGLTLSDEIIIVDIDHGQIKVVTCEEMETSQGGENEKVPEFPKSRKKLESNINDIKKKIKQDNIDKDYHYVNGYIDREFNTKLNEAFFLFNCDLLKNYSKYLNQECYSTSQPDFVSLFKINDFLSAQSGSDKPFYLKFLSETQIFGDFLYKRMIPKDSNEKIQILAFDEKINEISQSNLLRFNTTPVSIFSSSKEYEYTTKVNVNGPRPPSQSELSFYQKESNQKGLLCYGIIVSKDSNNSNNVTFTYPIFPVFTTNLFFTASTIKEYFIPLTYSEDVERINADLVSKSHLGGVAERQSDMKNYINLCWIQLWAMSFWYHEPQEKKFRFGQLLQVIKKVTSHDMEVFNIVFDALTRYGTDDMILNLYDIILGLKLNPSVKVRETAMKLKDKNEAKQQQKQKQIRYTKSKRLSEDEITSLYEVNSGVNSKFKPRTLKNRYNSNVLSEDVTFLAGDECIDCGNSINLVSVSKKYDLMHRDIMWAECLNPQCHMPLLPKISVLFGHEMNKEGTLKNTTAVFENIVLFSPQYLHINYRDSLIKTYGTKLDVEEFKMRFSAIFWNSIWYFKIADLDYQLFLPYEMKLDHKATLSPLSLKIYLNDKKEKKVMFPKVQKEENKSQQPSVKLLQIITQQKFDHNSLVMDSCKDCRGEILN